MGLSVMVRHQRNVQTLGIRQQNVSPGFVKLCLPALSCLASQAGYAHCAVVVTDMGQEFDVLLTEFADKSAGSDWGS